MRAQVRRGGIAKYRRGIHRSETPTADFGRARRDRRAHRVLSGPVPTGGLVFVGPDAVLRVVGHVGSGVYHGAAVGLSQVAGATVEALSGQGMLAVAVAVTRGGRGPGLLLVG